MLRAPVAPVALGCCRTEPRCAWCGPPPPLPTPELVDAMATHYRDPERGVRVAFFGGEVPPPELLAAAGGAPISLRVRPDALEPEQLPALLAAGVDHIELDALTLDDHALRDLGRRYTGSRVLAMAKGLRSRGLQVGAVLSPGLPRTSHDTAVRDAEQLAPHLHTARVHPALAP